MVDFGIVKLINEIFVRTLINDLIIAVLDVISMRVRCRLSNAIVINFTNFGLTSLIAIGQEAYNLSTGY